MSSERRRDGIRFRLTPLRAVMLSCGINTALALLIPVPVHAAQPAEMQLQSAINAGVDAARTNATTMTIQQTASKAILDWSKMNVRAQEALIFDQQGNRNWAALNRIHDLSPSTIAGTVRADGHLYFINTNGIIFANGAQVNVGSLTATSLDLGNDQFLAGVLSGDPRNPVFTGASGFVRVEEGANLTAARGGKILLFAPDVENHGIIQTPEGQTILAAGQKVYLLSSEDPAGFLVEVDAGGSAKNLGQIIADRGNVTMVGLAVNQEGRISATTSVRANGSIRLLARDTARITTNNATGETTFSATRAGTLTLGANSKTEILPAKQLDPLTGQVTGDDPEASIDAQSAPASRVELQGKQVTILGEITAPGGSVDVSAVVNPYTASTSYSAEPATRIYLGENAKIDVAGIRDVAVGMDRHQLAVRLFTEQLKDAPLLRGGPLYRETVYVDAREGTPLFDIGPSVALKTRTVAERLATGGSVSLKSEGDVITLAGSSIDVSGGSVQYQAGEIKTSKLVYQGTLYDISQATPDRPYESQIEVTRHVAGYVEGRDAGSVTLQGRAMAIEGELKGGTVIGPYQREESRRPRGATLQIGRDSGSDYVAPGVRFVNGVAVLPAGFGPSDALDPRHAQQFEIDARLLNQGFSGLAVYSNGHIDVDAPLNMAPGASVLLSGNQIRVNADIVAASGDITLQIKDTVGGDTGSPVPSGDDSIRIGSGVTVSAAGLWTNDTPGVPGAITSAIAPDGGKIKIAALEALTVGAGAVLDVSSGAWRTADGKLKTGDSGATASLTLGFGDLELNGELRGYAFDNRRRELTLTRSGIKDGNNIVHGDIQIGGANPNDPWVMWLPETFFQQGGFTKYSVSTTAPDAKVTVAQGASILPQALNYVPRPGYGAIPSGAALAQVARPVLLPEYQRRAADIVLSAAASGTVTGSVLVEQGALIRTDAGGNISLTAGDDLWIDGSLVAPGGSISATIAALADAAFDATQSLWVGANARLLAQGYYRVRPSNNGLLSGELFEGGTIDLGAGRGYLVLEDGSVLDVSGTSGATDLLTADGYRRTQLEGGGGLISLAAREGLLAEGDLLGRAGGAGAAGGELRVALNGAINPVLVYPTNDRRFVFSRQRSRLAQQLVRGAAIPAGGFNGLGTLGVDQVAQGGFDRLSITSMLRGRFPSLSRDRIEVEGGLDATLRAALSLQAPIVALTGTGDATLRAAYLKLGRSADSDRFDAAYLTRGTNTLSFIGDWIDLNGAIGGGIGISGAGAVALTSRLDIRGYGSNAVAGGVDNSAGLTTPADIALTARQIYPATNTGLSFTVSGEDAAGPVTGRITVASSGEAPIPVFSAGGRLSLTADAIELRKTAFNRPDGSVVEMGGVLKAPVGSITLAGGDTVSLSDHSLVSTSSEGLAIPFGETSAAFGWEAPSADGFHLSIATPPEKRIVLKAPNVDVQAGAVVDVSGGGELFAYEWIPGIGGSKDVLAQPNTYAVLPGYGGEYAPFDFNYNRTADARLRAGDAVFLEGGAGLSRGVYTLLPARYALLPGAYMVQVASGSAAVRPGESIGRIDGSSTVAGFRTVLGANTRSAAWGSYTVTPGSVFYDTSAFPRSPAEYRVTLANTYFAEKALRDNVAMPRLPKDAGQLVFSTSNSLQLNGAFHALPGASGAGAMVDIDAPSIHVVSAAGAPVAGVLQLEADKLSALHAESLLLGGTRSTVADGVAVTTSATNVDIDNDAQHPLKAGELVAVATDTVRVEANAYVAAEGGEHADASPLLLSGEGALVRVASTDREVRRSAVPAAPTKGTLDVAGTLKGKAIALDATLANTLGGTLDISHGGFLNIGAPRISLGDAGGAVSGFQFFRNDLAALAQLSRMVLRSYSTLDVYKPFTDANGQAQAIIDNTDLDLVVDAAGIAGYGASGDTAVLNVGTFMLRNPDGRSYAAAPGRTLGSGTLQVEADSITFGPVATGREAKVAGFDGAEFSAKGLLGLEGSGTLNLDVNHATLRSVWLGATGDGVDFDVNVTGGLSFAGNTPPAGFSASVGSVAALRFTAADVDVAGGATLVVPSGDLTLRATSGDVSIGPGATVLASGLTYDFEGAMAYTPGGTVRLVSDAGDVRVHGGAYVDVSAQGDADAGLVQVSAVQGTAAVAGFLNGGSTNGRSGRFEADAGYVNTNVAATSNDVDALNALLDAGKFNEERILRVRQGHVALAGAAKAHRFVLSADNGGIDVSGRIDASGDKGGEIALFAKGQLNVNAGAELDASATGNGRDGGSVLLATQTSAVDGSGKPLGVNLNGGLIEAGGGSGGRGGVVHLRAPRNAANNDLAIAAIGTVIDGARLIQAEGYRTYTDASITSSDLSTAGAWYTQAASFMQQIGAIRSRLNMAGNGAFALTPGIDVESSGALALSNDWSLAGWRYDPDTGAVAPAAQLASGLNADGKALLAGVLTLRAAGDLSINGSLSDGFASALANGAAQGLNAWSFRLVAGADATSASPLAVTQHTGNMTLASGKLVRTGRGDIDIRAGGNLTMGNESSVIYTAGSQAEALAGFDPNRSPTKLGKSPYLEGGGHVYIRVGGDLIGKVATRGNQQLVNNWLFRQGELNPDSSFKTQTSWWLRPDLFKQGVATFGGGDIVLEAGGRVENFSAAAATTGRVAVDPVSGQKLAPLVLGGGDLTVRAGGDILSGVYHVGKGEGRIISGGEIKSATNTFGTALSMQDGRFAVRGTRGVYLETTFNPTLAPQSSTNVTTILSPTEPASFFATYGADSRLDLAALSGELRFSTNVDTGADGLPKPKLADWVRNGLVGATGTGYPEGWSYYPGALKAAAFAGDIRAVGLTLYPAAHGQLALLAGKDIRIDNLLMSDADPALLPGPLNPIRSPYADAFKLTQALKYQHASGVLHRNDPFPAYLVAGGAIAPYGATSSATSFNLTVPKRAVISAATDVVNLNARIQHVAASDLTSISAGRKLVYDQRVNDATKGIFVYGPGELLATAGSDVDLGKSGGIQSLGNVENPSLSPSAASVTVGAGFAGGVDVSAFVAQYIDPTGAMTSPETAAALADYMRQVTGDSSLSPADAWAAYASLDERHQMPFAFRVFSDELRYSSEGPERGDAAIATLFPGQSYSGDLLMFESKIATARDGSIDLLVPGGEINAGLAGAETTRNIGIITEKGGEIRAFADSGFFVNQSKVITQFGSDIVIWVTEGDIDAGRGSTTALSVPERIASTDPDGNTTVEYKGVATGSGIRAQSYDPDGPSGPAVAPAKGAGVLRAWRGKLNAGDAGIEAGDLDVSALVVLNTDAIQVSGSVKGVTLDAGSLAPPPPPAADQKATEETTRSLAKNIGDQQKALEDTRNALASFKPSFITVEVIGFGETGSASGTDCPDGSKSPECRQERKPQNNI